MKKGGRKRGEWKVGNKKRKRGKTSKGRIWNLKFKCGTRINLNYDMMLLNMISVILCK